MRIVKFLVSNKTRLKFLKSFKDRYSKFPSSFGHPATGYHHEAPLLREEVQGGPHQKLLMKFFKTSRDSYSEFPISRLQMDSVEPN